MDCKLASFVGLIGPGQVLDRESLVAIPAGYAKVIICNNQDNLCVFLSELRESLDEPSLDIKLFAKATLTVGHEVVKGGAVISDTLNRVLLNRDLAAVMIDKTQLMKRGMSRCDIYNCIMGGEVLQICIYASKRKASRRHQIGYVTIDSSQISRGAYCCTESWYKIFPSSSYIPGLPVSSSRDSRSLIRSRSASVTPVSSISPSIMALLMSMPSQRQSVSASMFRFVGEDFSPSDVTKRDSIETTSDVSISIDPADDLSVCSSRTHSICSSSTDDSSNNNLVLRQKPAYHKSDSQLHLGTERKNIPSQSSEVRNKKQKRFSLQFRRRATVNVQSSNVKRCNEVICNEGVDEMHGECCEMCDESVLDFSVESTNDALEEPTFVEPSHSNKDSSRSNRSEAEEVLPDKHREEDNLSLPLKNTRTRTVSYIRSWAQTLSIKLKNSLIPTPQENAETLSEKKLQRKSVSSIFDDEIDEHDDNAYKVLKYVQSLPKPPRRPTEDNLNTSSISNSKASLASCESSKFLGSASEEQTLTDSQDAVEYQKVDLAVISQSRDERVGGEDNE